MLSDAERRVLLMYCASHPAARCPQCHEDITAGQLGADVIGGTRDFCPSCRTDLTEPVRWHIITCENIAATVGEVVEQGRLLRKITESERTRSETLRAESQALAYRVLQSRRGTS